MNISICLIANFNKTFFFDRIADKLKSEEIDIYWIVFNKKLNEFLVERYGREKVLYLPKNDVLNSNHTEISDFKLNELILGDRILNYQFNVGVKFLSAIQQPIFDFIKKNQIRFVFGEITWAHELLIHRMVSHFKELNCIFLNPHTVRIPSGRFAFFTDEFQSEMYIVENDFKKMGYSEEFFVAKKPDYLELNDKLLKKSNSFRGRLKKVKYYLTSENLDENDITLPPKNNRNRTLNPIKLEINKESYKLVNKVPFDFLKDKKFIFVALHKQPESSIDVLGRYYEDQKQNIINIWRQLPSDYFLVIKEHTNAIGDRPLKFYKDLLKLQNIILVDERTDSYALIHSCKAVVTVSGTVAYEAALMNKKALVFAPVFFKLSKVVPLTIERLKYSKNFSELITEIYNDDNNIKAMIQNNSFEGIISDPISNKSCMTQNNIESVTQAFFKVFRTYLSEK